LSFRLQVDSVSIVDGLFLGFVDHTGQRVAAENPLINYVSSPVANIFMQVTAPFAALGIAKVAFTQINVSYHPSGPGPVLYFDDVRLCGP
jgi:hypothetical protein